MMNCRDVSHLVSSGELADQPWRRRIAVRLHLVMCRHCRAFAREVRQLTRTARHVSDNVATEPAADFEARVVRRLHER